MVRMLHLRQLGVGGHEIYARRQQPQVFHVGALDNHVRSLGRSGDTFVYSGEVYVEAESRGGIGLGVRIKQQHLLPQKGY